MHKPLKQSLTVHVYISYRHIILFYFAKHYLYMLSFFAVYILVTMANKDEYKKRVIQKTLI